MFVAAKPKRVKRKHAHAKTPSLPATTSPSNSTSLPLRARSELDRALPPPYAAICPPDHRSSPQPNGRPPRPRTAASTANLNVPPLQPPSWGYRQHDSSSASVSRAPGNSDRYARDNQDRWQAPSLEDVAHGALCSLISSKFDSVITSIDGEEFGGAEKDLTIRDEPQSGLRGGWGFTNREISRGANKAVSSAVMSTNYFAKANLYANSKLPPHLPPLKL